jgi:hypothetical protein
VKRPIGLLLVLALLGCKNGDAGKPSGADVRWADAGPEISLGTLPVALPTDDFADGAKPSVVQDDPGVRYAYTTKSGEIRVLYKVGDDVFVGPKMAAPVEFKRAPDLDGALGALFENAKAPGLRAKLVADVKKTLGDVGTARMLADGAGVDAPEWNEAYAGLGDPGKKQLATAMGPLLQKGKPAAGLKRAVIMLPMRDPPPTAQQLEDRVRELAPKGEEQAAVGVLLRTLSKTARPRGAAVGCEVLKTAKKGQEETDPSHEILIESALVAIANDVLAGGALACKEEVAAALFDPCAPYLRCTSGAPLTGHETTTQEEPLCTKQEVATVVGKEIERTPADAVAASHGTRRELFAYAALLGANALPETFTAAHERRRYPITQPKEPACDSGLPVNTACHCDEAVLRDKACRGPSMHPGLCKADVDDKAKKITNVVTAIGN